MKLNFSLLSGLKSPEKVRPQVKHAVPEPTVQDGWSRSSGGTSSEPLLKPFSFQPRAEAAPKEKLGPFQPILNTVKLSAEQKASPVPAEVLERAQAYLDRGDRGAAYLTLYQELGSEQILIQTGITTYTGFWGSGALTGNHMAMQGGGERYNTQLDTFSVEIAQATIDAIRKDQEKGGTGRLSIDEFQAADRDVWRQKGMPELFPGNVQFMDFWNHGEGDGLGEAFFSTSTMNMIGAGMRAMIPNTSFLGLNQDGRNLNSLIGKRPAEFENDPNYTIHGGEKDRFITVVDNKTGFIEAFWDKRPRIANHFPLRQLPNKALAKDSPEYAQRKKLYEELGANKHRPA